MSVTGLLTAAIWWHATRDHRLVDADLSPRVIRRERWRALGLAGVFIVSIGIAFLNADLAKFSWLPLLVVLYIVSR